MAEELNLKFAPFFEKVDAVYDEFPVLKKGDSAYCQNVIQSVTCSLKEDLIRKHSLLPKRRFISLLPILMALTLMATKKHLAPMR